MKRVIFLSRLHVCAGFLMSGLPLAGQTPQPGQKVIGTLMGSSIGVITNKTCGVAPGTPVTTTRDPEDTIRVTVSQNGNGSLVTVSVRVSYPSTTAVAQIIGSSTLRFESALNTYAEMDATLTSNDPMLGAKVGTVGLPCHPPTTPATGGTARIFLFSFRLRDFGATSFADFLPAEPDV